MEDSGEEPDVVEERRGRETRWSSTGSKATRTRTTRMRVDDYRLSQLITNQASSNSNINTLKPTNFKQLPNTPNPKPSLCSP